MPSGGPRHPRTPSLASTTVSSSSPTMSALRRFISTAYRKRAGIGLQLCHCAVVPGALYGFCGQDPTGLSDGQLEGTADFRIVLDPMTVFVAGERHGDRFIVRLFDVSELLWLEVGTQTQRDRWLSALCGIGGISQTDYFDLEGICNGTAADQDLSLRRSRSFVSTISRAEWPMPPSIIPVSLSSMGPTLRGWRPRDKNMVKQHLARAEKTAGSKPSLDAVGGQADEPEGLLSRLPQWFKRRGSLSS
ncbi:hypothetical protein EC988_007417 [Linderina pennispora]|nr:hypothetical protein EC988_007417 [Linderina pennispora]